MNTRFTFRLATIGLLGIACIVQAPLVFGQDPNQAPQDDQRDNPGGGWRRLGDTQAQDQQQPQYDPRALAQAPPDYSQRQGPGGPPPPDYRGRPYPNDRQGPPPPAPPAQLNIAPGTFFTVRVNQPLSSDHNQPGDAFTAQLVKPIVVDGVIVADRGQTIVGRVAEVDKGGRVKGVSRLGIELTELTLADGQQVPLRSQLISHQAPDSVGRDATAIGATTGIGALAGAAAGGGEGAAIGAGAGAFASAIGVLLTRGYPTIIRPESVLTFRIEAPIAVNTSRAPLAFRYVEQGDYNQPSDQPRMRTRAPGYGPNPYYGPYYSGGWYGPWGNPYYYGPSVGIFYGPRFYGGGFRGGFRGGRR